MTTRYRIDFQPTDDHQQNLDNITVIFMGDRPGARQRAMRKARQISARKDVTTCYAIMSIDNVDRGQRVYVRGAFSHQDDRF